MESFGSFEVARITGASVRQLQWWDEEGLVSPRQDGHARCYLPEEVFEIDVIVQLRQRGVSLQRCRRFLKALRREIAVRGGDYSGFLLIQDTSCTVPARPSRISVEDNKGRIIDALKAAGGAFLVSLDDLRDRIDGETKRLTATAATADVARPPLSTVRAARHTPAAPRYAPLPG